MRILIVSYSYTPHVSPRSLRWKTISEHYVSQGHDVQVLTSLFVNSTSLERLNGVLVHRIGNRIIEKLRRRLYGSLEPVTEDVTEVTNVKPYSKLLLNVSHAIKWIYNHTWKLVYWPDYACLWIIPALSYAVTLLNRENIDLLITVAPPFSGHLVGLALRRKHPKLQWIVDSGDPFCFLEQPTVNNHYFYNRLNYSIEKRIFGSANAVSVTTEQTANIYSQLLKGMGEKIKVIPPLLNTENMKSVSEEKSMFRQDRIILVYIGSFYSGVREPDEFFRLIQAVTRISQRLCEKLEVHFFGQMQTMAHIIKDFTTLSPLLQLHGPVTHKVAMKALNQADMLVNIGNRNGFQLPSKLVEYVYSGKPLLNIRSSKEDSSLEILGDYPLAMNVFEMKENDVAAAAYFIEQSCHQRVDREIVEGIIAPFRVDIISGQYLSLILS